MKMVPKVVLMSAAAPATPWRPARPALWMAAVATSLLVLAGTGSAEAQAPPDPPTDRCAEPPATAATPPPRGPSSGTAPGAEGSTGWTGGTGGSHTGLSPGAPAPGSPTEHPPTVKGVDPKVEQGGRERC